MVLMALSIAAIRDLQTPEALVPLAAWRLAVGTAFLVPPVLLRRQWRESFFGLLRPSAAWKIAIPGSILGAGFAMLAWIAGFTLIEESAISTAAMLNQFSTIYIFILATVVLKEPLTRRRAATIALAFAGAIVVMLG